MKTVSMTSRNLLRFVLALVLLAAAALSFAQIGTRNIDHVKTGFPLTGSHATQRCEACHINGMFKGTPKDCVGCHSAGARGISSVAVKPANHVPTTQACDTCHNTVSFSNARVNHSMLAPNSCLTCHNGTFASGKPANHVPTTASCQTCHRTIAWIPAAGFDHSTVVAGTCATCHNGSRATGKPATHIPTTASCDTCHKTTGWTPATFSHSGVAAGTCATCHNGTSATGKPANHLPTTASDRKSTRLNSSHIPLSRMPSSA